MTYQGQMPVKLTGAIAGTGLTASTVQYKFVKLSADNTVVLCASATDVPIGVLQAPVSATGDPVDVTVIGETQLQAGGSVTAGNLIGTTNAGQAVALTPGADTTKYVVGQAVNVASATSAGNLLTAVVNCVSPGRAA